MTVDDVLGRTEALKEQAHYAPKRDCPSCDGTGHGEVDDADDYVISYLACPACEGTGEVDK